MAKVELTAAQQAVIDSMKTDAEAYGAPSTVTIEKTADQAVRASTAARTLLIRQNGAVETDFGPGKPRRSSSTPKSQKASTGRTTARKGASSPKSASKSSKSTSSRSKSKTSAGSKSRTGGKK